MLTGAFANYPIYKTTSQNEGDILGLTAQQSHLLAAQAEPRWHKSFKHRAVDSWISSRTGLVASSYCSMVCAAVKCTVFGLMTFSLVRATRIPLFVLKTEEYSVKENEELFRKLLS